MRTSKNYSHVQLIKQKIELIKEFEIAIKINLFAIHPLKAPIHSHMRGCNTVTKFIPINSADSSPHAWVQLLLFLTEMDIPLKSLSIEFLSIV